MFIGKIMIILTSMKEKFIILIKNKEDCDYKRNVYKLFKSLKFRVITVFSIIILISFMFWYYLVIFCNLYSNNQISWIQSTLISIGFNLIIPIILCFLFGSIKFCGIKYQNKILFSTGHFLLKFF